MSGPNAPGNSPIRLPQGMTHKPMGADRIPQTPGVPPVNPAAATILAARQAGVDPALIQQRPGYTPPPQRAAPAQRTMPALPQPQGDTYNPPNRAFGSVPLPQPRPAGAPGPVPVPNSFAPVTGGADALRAALQQKAANMQMQMQVPPQADPQVATPPQADPQAAAMAQAKQQLAQMMAAAQQPPPGPKDAAKDTSVQTPLPVPPTAPPSQGKFTPSVETSVYMMRNPDPEAYSGDGKKGKGKGNEKPAKPVHDPRSYGSSMNYYRILGVDENASGHELDTALRQLQKRAKENPETITRDEDRLLASSAKNQAFNKSLEESAIQKRFAEYGKPEEERAQSSVAPGRVGGDPAQSAVNAYIANMGAPVWQGRPNAPTQADVNNGARPPQQSPQYTPPPPLEENDPAATTDEED